MKELRDKIKILRNGIKIGTHDKGMKGWLKGYQEGYGDGVNRCIDLIESYNPWHRWPAEKPEYEVECLVKVMTSIRKVGYLSKCNDGHDRWFDTIRGDLIYDVTHFCELPELPKDVK